MNDERKLRSILLFPKKNKRDIMLELLCTKLEQVNMEEPIVMKEFEQDFLTMNFRKKDIALIKSLTNENNNEGSTAIALVKQFRKELKDGVRHPIMHYVCKVGSNIGTMKFVFKVKDDEYEERKSMGISSSEENMPKLTTKSCKQQVRSEMKIFSKSRLMHTNSNASCLTKVLTD